MAKKNESEETPKAKASSLDSVFTLLAEQHNKLQPKIASFGEEAIHSEVHNWISTGSVALDTIISNKAVGGWPCGRVVELYGEPGYGKSSICFQGMANCQQAGGLVIFIDAEGAASEELMQAYGVDTSKLLYSNLTLVEDIFDALEKNLTTIATTPALKDKPVFICVDSLASLKSRKLVEGTYDYNMNTQGEFAKILGLALKRMLQLLHNANACLVIINQMRDKIGVVGGDTKYTPGGNALKFYASLSLRLLGRKLHTIKEPASGEDVAVGADVTVRTDKNKMGPTMRKVNFHLDFVRGIQEHEEWLAYLVNLGYLTRGGAWYGWTDKIGIASLSGKKFQRPDFETFFEDASVYEAVKGAIIKGFILNLNDDKRLQEEQKAAEAVKE